MNPFLWILTVLGALIGLILLFVIYLFFGKIRLVVDYRKGDLKLWLEFLFLKYAVYPDPEKQQRNKQEKRAQEQKQRSNDTEQNVSSRPPAPPSGSPKKKRTVRRAAKREIRKALKGVGLKDYATILKVIVTEFFAKFECKSLVIYASVGGEDAMAIAMEYGTINALLYPVLGAFSAAGKLKQGDIQITPDFTAEETHAEGRAVFTFRLFRAFRCVWELSEKLY